MSGDWELLNLDVDMLSLRHLGTGADVCWGKVQQAVTRIQMWEFQHCKRKQVSEADGLKVPPIF